MPSYRALLLAVFGCALAVAGLTPLPAQAATYVVQPRSDSEAIFVGYNLQTFVAHAYFGTTEGGMAQLSTSVDNKFTYFNWIGLEAGRAGTPVPVEGSQKYSGTHVAWLDAAKTVDLVTAGANLKGYIQIRNRGGTAVHVIIERGDLQ